MHSFQSCLFVVALVSSVAIMSYARLMEQPGSRSCSKPTCPLLNAYCSYCVNQTLTDPSCCEDRGCQEWICDGFHWVCQETCGECQKPECPVVNSACSLNCDGDSVHDMACCSEEGSCEFLCEDGIWACKTQCGTSTVKPCVIPTCARASSYCQSECQGLNVSEPDCCNRGYGCTDLQCINNVWKCTEKCPK